MPVVEILIVLAMLAINAAFAAFELALASVRPAQLQLAVDARRHGARAAVAMRQQMDASLAVVQLGITLAGAIAAATGGAGVEENLAPWFEARLGVSESWAEVLALSAFVLPLAAFTIVFGELVPKLLALRDPVRICLRLAPTMRVFSAAVRPLVHLLTGAVGLVLKPPQEGSARAAAAGLAELRAQIRLLGSSREIGGDEERLLLAASQLSRTPVREIVVPVESMATLPLDIAPEEALVLAMSELHTRFPVTRTRGAIDDIVGYVNFKELVAAAHAPPGDGRATTLGPILRTLPAFRGNLPLGAALRAMVPARIHVALVHDEGDRLIGMMTLEDVFEELVGEIEDELDVVPDLVERRDDGWVVGGGARIDRIRKVTGQPGFAADVDGTTTVDAFLRGDPPRRRRPGDTLAVGPWTLVVREVRRQRVTKALVRSREPAPVPGAVEGREARSDPAGGHAEASASAEPSGTPRGPLR